MQFNSIGRSGNFAQAGKSAADDTLKSFIASRRNAPDYGKIVKEGMENRSAEKRAAMSTSSQVHRAGMKAKAGVQEDKILYGAKRERDSARRKAGALGAAGKMFGGIANAGGDEPIKPFKGGLDYGKVADDLDAEATAIRDGLDKPSTPTSKSTPKSNGGGTSSTKTTPGLSTYTPPKPGKIYSQSEIETLAVQGGFSQEEAPLVAKIAMGESSGDPTAFNGEGRDQSYGIMQINMLGEMGPERRAQFGISSNEELNDPLTNMKAAHAIYKQQGWGAWGAYTNGSYAKF